MRVSTPTLRLPADGDVAKPARRQQGASQILLRAQVGEITAATWSCNDVHVPNRISAPHNHDFRDG